MKKLILSVAIAVTALFASPATVEAGCCKPEIKKSCCKKVQNCKPSTVEVCRRCYTKTERVCGCCKTIRYVEVTYRTTNCNGRTKVFKKTYRA